MHLIQNQTKNHKVNVTFLKIYNTKLRMDCLCVFNKERLFFTWYKNVSFHVFSYCIWGKIIDAYFAIFAVEFKCAFI